MDLLFQEYSQLKSDIAFIKAKITESGEKSSCRWVSQKQLMKELDCSITYLRKLEENGLSRHQVEHGDKKVYYDRKQLDEMMARFNLTK